MPKDKRNKVSHFLDEPVRLQGVPDIVVTRLWAREGATDHSRLDFGQHSNGCTYQPEGDQWLALIFLFQDRDVDRESKASDEETC